MYTPKEKEEILNLFDKAQKALFEVSEIIRHKEKCEPSRFIFKTRCIINGISSYSEYVKTHGELKDIYSILQIIP
jgi:flagellin-specific chaperone FliS